MIKNPSTQNEVFTSFVNLSRLNVISKIEETNSALNFKPIPPLIVCGPSGTGKTTLLKRLMKEFDDLFGFCISRMYLMINMMHHIR